MASKNLSLKRRLSREIRHRLNGPAKDQFAVFAFLVGIAFLVGVAIGFLIAGRVQDWNFALLNSLLTVALVVITAIYVIITFLLLRIGDRQAVAAELNANLLRNQMENERYRRAGPIRAAAREIILNVVKWESAARKRDITQDLPDLLPPNFDTILSYSTTSEDLYNHQELEIVQKKLGNASAKMKNIRSAVASSPEWLDSEFINLQAELKSARSHLGNILTNIEGPNEEQ